jgi:hypothetical protein
MKRNIIKIQLNSRCNAKLAFVKMVKEISGLGLKEAKYISDRIFNEPFRQFEFEVLPEVSIEDVRNRLSDIEFESQYPSINGGTQYQRELKMLQLGIGDKEDVVNFISQSILGNFGNSEEILEIALNKLSKQDLEEILNTLNYK